MCFASPMKQPDMTHPAPYPLDKAYGNVTSNSVAPDGKVTGGKTVAQQYQDNLKAATPASPKASATSGANTNFSM